MERRLAAILSSDVVGYSRAMGVDEAGTLETLKSHRREVIDPKAAQYGGRTIKLMGDGALMEFASVVDAVAFAVEVQCAMAERNAELPEDRRLLYRVGINLGDIIVEGDDIFGDGVNIAARLQALAREACRTTTPSRIAIERIAGSMSSVLRARPYRTTTVAAGGAVAPAAAAEASAAGVL